MPPPTRVCVRCKSTKSKCVNFDPGQWPDGPIARKCDRCARLGFDCVPAPSAVPKPRAPRKAKTAAGGGLLLNVAPSPLVTRALQQIPGTTTSSATETLSYVLSPGASPLAARRAPPRDGRMPVAAMPTALLWGDEHPSPPLLLFAQVRAASDSHDRPPARHLRADRVCGGALPARRTAP